MTRRRRTRKSKSSPLAGCFYLLLLVAIPIGAIRSCIAPDPPPDSGWAAQSADPIIPTTTETPTPTPARTPTPLSGSLAGGTPAPEVTAKPVDDGRNDVTLLDCSWKTDSFSMTEASTNVRIVNHTDSAQFYMVEVGLNNAQGKLVGTATAVSDSLPSGSSVTVTGSAYPGGPIPGMRCELSNVTRIPLSTSGTAAGGLADLGPHVGVPHLDLDLPHLHVGHGGHGHN